MLEVRNIKKYYEGQELLKGVSFQVGEGETVCLLGRSGSGKSTLLRIITGLEDAESGEVLWDQKNLAGVQVHKRNFGLMFQDYALFPHRTVAENVAFGLRMKGLPQSEIAEKVKSALEQVNLQEFGHRRVTDLSGGEQQRVALARALAPQPRLLMLDEPLGALDRALREQLTEELRALLHISSIPAIYVTHDQEEAYTIADRLIILHEGQIVQEGTPAEIYARPANPWVARFLGLTNFLEGEIVSLDPLTVQTPLGEMVLDQQVCSNFGRGKSVQLLFRPSGGSVVSMEPAENSNVIHGKVLDVVFRGEMYRMMMQCASGHQFQFYLEHPIQEGSEVALQLDTDSILCLEN